MMTWCLKLTEDDDWCLKLTEDDDLVFETNWRWWLGVWN
jgi:hypothetical protein